MKNRKRFVFVLLALLTLGLTISVGAYWANVVNAPDAVDETYTVTVGEAQDVTTTLAVNETTGSSGKVLVPAGRTAVSQAPAGYTIVEKITFTFNVVWADKDHAQAAGTVGTLTVASSNISNPLLVVTILQPSQTIVLGSSAVTVTVEVTLTEPATQAEYDSVVNQALTFDLTFTVTPQ